MNTNIKFLMEENDLRIDEKFILKDEDKDIRFEDISPFWINSAGNLCSSKGYLGLSSTETTVFGNIVLKYLTIYKFKGNSKKQKPTEFMKMLGVNYKHNFCLVDNVDDKYIVASYKNGNDYRFKFNENGFLVNNFGELASSRTLARLVAGEIVIHKSSISKIE